MSSNSTNSAAPSISLKAFEGFSKNNHDPSMDCHWHQEDFFNTSKNKVVLSVTFLCLLSIYTILVFLRYRDGGKSVQAQKLFDIINNFAFSHLFYYIAAILVHTIVPKAFPVVMVYLYMVTIIGEGFASYREHQRNLKLMWGLQTIILVILYISILSDDWCRFYLYRGHA